MSSFVHTPEVINYIVNVISRVCPTSCRSYTNDNWKLEADKLAKAMMLLNVESVNRRYRENEPVPDISYHDIYVVNLMQGFKYLQSYLYQICDCCDMEEELPRLLIDAKGYIAATIIRDLPEYEACQWS